MRVSKSRQGTIEYDYQRMSIRTEIPNCRGRRHIDAGRNCDGNTRRLYMEYRIESGNIVLNQLRLDDWLPILALARPLIYITFSGNGHPDSTDLLALSLGISQCYDIFTLPTGGGCNT